MSLTGPDATGNASNRPGEGDADAGRLQDRRRVPLMQTITHLLRALRTCVAGTTAQDALRRRWRDIR